MLDVVIYRRANQATGRELDAFRAGLLMHSIEPEIRATQSVRACDLAVFWAHKQAHIIRQQQMTGGQYLVMERGYFGDRFAMTSLGFNGLNGHADFCNDNSRSDRWAKHGVEVREWKSEHDGDCGVIMGQVPGDASLAPCPNYARWVVDAAKQARDAYDVRIVFRQHPHPAAAHFKPAGVALIGGSLSDVLSRARFVIVYNSNSGVDAALAGVPVIACNRGAMSWPIATHVIGDALMRPDRQRWLNDLAYCQWTEREIRTGAAWEHLQQRFATTHEGCSLSAGATPHRTGTN